MKIVRKMFRLAVDNPPYFGLCLVAAGELCINACWGWLSATWWPHALLLTMIYAGAEMAKWFAAEGVGAAWRDFDKVRGASWVLVLICTLSISIPAHIGMIGYLRDGAVQNLGATATKHNNAEKSLRDAAAELAIIGVTRTPDEIKPERELECSRTSRSYPDGKGPKCTGLLSEEAKALRKVDLQKQLSADEQKLSTNNASFADARIEVLGWVFPNQKPEHLQLMMSIAIAMALEAITAFGFIAVGHRPSEKLTLDHLVNSGAATHPTADTIVAFRADMLERRPAAVMAEDEVWQAYHAWSHGKGREPMARPVFLRLFEATGANRSASGMFLGLRIKQRAA